MSDTTVAAEPEAEAVIENVQVETPLPVENKPPEAEPVEKVPSVRDSVEKGLKAAEESARLKDEAKAEEAKKAEKPKAEKADNRSEIKKDAEEPEKKEELVKADKEADKSDELPVTESEKAAEPEKPAPKHAEPPARFSPDAKAEWDKVPEPVQAEAHRAFKELESGIEQYRQVLEPVKPYMDLAKEHGTTIQQALEQYTTLEKLLTSDPLAGLQHVADYAGIDLRKVAAHIMGQTPDETASQQDSILRQINNRVAGLENEIKGVATSISEQKADVTTQEVGQFFETNPRMKDDWFADKVADEIKLIQPSMPDSTPASEILSIAYDRADRLNPAAPTPPPVSPVPDAQPVKETKSVSGSPSTGTTETRGPAPSIRAALERHIPG